MTKIIKIKQSDIAKIVDNIVNEQMSNNFDNDSEFDTLDADIDEPESDEPESDDEIVTNKANNEFIVAKDKEGNIYLVGPDGDVLLKTK
jgi:hypothetical protein